jgi:hypothetical protein
MWDPHFNVRFASVDHVVSFYYDLQIFDQHKGSQVTFLLDLTGDGTLSASVDGTSFHQLFSDMHSKVRSVNPEGGFVPAIDLNRSDQKVRVRFLGFESGQDEKERL